MTGDSTLDPVALDPGLFDVRFENESIRVLETKIPPGQGHGMHEHPKHLIYTLSSYTVQDSFPDGTTELISRTAGEVVWGDELTHAMGNVGQTVVHALIIEFKSL